MNLDQQLATLGIDRQQLIKDLNLTPRSQKSNLAQARSTQCKSIDNQILESLKTYQWRETASILYFAMSLEVSEGYLRLRLKYLEKIGEVESFQDGVIKGKPRIIYRLTKANKFRYQPLLNS